MEGVCEAGTSQTPSEGASSRSLCQHDRRWPLRLMTISPVVGALRSTLGSGGLLALCAQLWVLGAVAGRGRTNPCTIYVLREACPSVLDLIGWVCCA
ncbi:hypothetical protein SCHPADRAFT_555978 [Schizopora paradoxa]|uniref:Uncharacterized protein n=1 Tax=Schizopora paradoxa TaxID=27342 RepID=A0A0H2RXZ5_9AGAM|nr:hypothetical protein SCHPADRAFT_555978 [Schizopora paradoxa]